MDRIKYYKNFQMLTEIDIAGTFIHNGIRDFNKMESLYYDSEIFYVLYSISVGIERLQKVLIVLLEDVAPEEIENFEKSLITHSHQDLQTRINKKCGLSFTSHQNKFIQVLTNFYNTCRYDRFIYGNNYSKERELLIKYFTNNLEVEITSEGFINNFKERNSIRSHFGKIVGSISKAYYKMIRDTASNQNIYTYELRSDSPAEKVFLPDFKKDSLQEQYINEQVSLKEFLIYLINREETSGFFEFVDHIKPLNFDIALTQEYLSDICKGIVPQSLIDFVEFLYSEEVDNIKERLELVDVIGNEHVYFSFDEDEEEEEFEGEEYGSDELVEY